MQSNSGTHPKRKARLILIKGEGFDWVSYQLHAQEHLIGRMFGTILFPDDRYLSPKHANLYYEGDHLMLSDEGSTNGVFIKLKDPILLHDGAHFLSGEQLLRFDQRSEYDQLALPPEAGKDGTQFYGCPPGESILFRLSHLFRGQRYGSIFHSTSSSVVIGREQCDLSFPFDRHISGRHARVYQEGNQFYLQDIGSKNGTFFRINRPHRLQHGDSFFVGQQLMRIEMAD